MVNEDTPGRRTIDRAPPSTVRTAGPPETALRRPPPQPAARSPPLIENLYRIT